MFIYTFKSATLKLITLLFCVGVIFLVAVLEGSFFKASPVPYENQAVNATNSYESTVNTKNEIKCDTNELRVNYLASLGWQVDKSPYETQEIVIPATFNSVYSNYNSLQKKRGFDLSSYKGKTATRYSYNIINHTDKSQKVRANLIILDSRLVGGDISSTALNGFMKSLCPFNNFDKDNWTTGR